MAKSITISVLVIFLLASNNVLGQTNNSSVDQETYNLYMAGEWKTLTGTAEKAIKNGIDYYYLRIRAGIAWFERGNYEKSCIHFRAALGFSENDPVALEYLYYSYLNMGMYPEARLLSARFNAALKRKMKIKEGISLAKVFGETGVISNNSIKELSDSFPSGDFVTSYYIEDLWYYNGGADIYLGYALQAILAVNRYSINTLQRTGIAGAEKGFSHKGDKTGFYLKMNYQLNNGWSVGGAYRGNNGSYTSSYYLADSTGQYSFQTKADGFNHSFLGGYVAKRFPFFGAGVHLSRNDFWQGRYLQIGADIAYYPFGNTNLYLSGGYDRLISSAGKYSTQVVKATIGFRVISKIWMDGNLAVGDLANWADGSGIYVFDTSFPINSKAGLNLYLIEIIPGLSLSLSYTKQERINKTEIYSISDWKVTSTVFQKYYTSSIIGGLSWRF